MFVDLAISTHWCAWVLETRVGTKRSGIWFIVADISSMSGNRPEDVGGGREAPRKGLMGHQRYMFLRGGSCL